MTTAITRLYADADTAGDIARQLTREGIKPGAVTVVTADGRKRAALVEALKTAGVHESAVAGYAERLAGGAAALVAKVSHKPLGAAKLVRTIAARADAVALENVTEEFTCEEKTKMTTDNIMKDHRHIFLNAPVKAEPAGEFSARFGWPLLQDTPRKKNVYEGDNFMSASFWPTPLVKDTPRKDNLCPRDAAPKSAAFWKAPLLKDSPRQSNVIPGDFLPFSQTFGFATISRRP
ncbi:hypothetical protein [Rhodobacter maris]|uniref:Uncharacterized protein n=1 Tax=Rhodobacter maris TaxID=446682 RepID=A0A285RHL6_9RHOB|nr:hypothetical protein [Rhodobacter maris]SOB93218.1 hypothetical protein SAMN05877831_101139 [Rhodobacter maris]